MCESRNGKYYIIFIKIYEECNDLWFIQKYKYVNVLNVYDIYYNII